MASTYSPKLRFELIGAGEQAGLWGTTTNKNVGQLIEQAIAGVTTVELDGLSGNYTLTALDGAPDQSRSAVVKCTYAAAPASGTVNVIIPTQTKLYVFRNDCGQTITVKTAAQVTGVTLLNGEATLVFCDGTNALAGIATAGVGPTTVANGGTGATSFTAGFIKSPGGTGTLTSSSSVSLTADVSGVLPVANGGTGTSSFSSGRVLLGNGGSTPLAYAGIANNDVLTWDSALNTWKSAAPAGAGVTSITGSNIGVSSPTGAVTISLTSTNVINALTYTPYNSSNPAGYITSSSLSGYAQTGSSNTFTANQTINTGSTSILYFGSGSSQGIQWTGSLLQFGLLSSTYIQVQSGQFLVNTDNVFKPTAGSWLGYSDQRLKENIVDYTKGLAAIKTLRPVNYNFKDELGEQTNHKTYAGLIAQEVEQTPLADMIGEGPNGYKSLDSSELTYTLINAIKELSAQVDALKAEVATLKGV